MTLITAMTAESARSFFLKHKSYCSFALPAYFDFAPLLLAVKNALEQKQNGINDIGYKKACDFDNVNYREECTGRQSETAASDSSGQGKISVMFITRLCTMSFPLFIAIILLITRQE